MSEPAQTSVEILTGDYIVTIYPPGAHIGGGWWWRIDAPDGTKLRDEPTGIDTDWIAVRSARWAARRWLRRYLKRHARGLVHPIRYVVTVTEQGSP